MSKEIPIPTKAGTEAMMKIALVCDRWSGISIPYLIREIEAEAEANGRADILKRLEQFINAERTTE